MRKWFFLTLGLLALVGVVVSTQTMFSQAPADQAGEGPEKVVPPKIAVSKVVKVTVYPNSALISREVDVPKGDGLIELTVSELPQQTVQSSLYSEGNDGMRILTTRYRTRPVQQDTREEVRKLSDEMKKHQIHLEKIEADIKTIEQNLVAVSKLENFTDKTTVSATEKGGLNPEAVVKLITYVMEQRTEKTKELVKLRQEAKTIGEQFGFLQRKLSSISSGTSKIERDAVIVIDRSKAMGGKIKLNYLVDSATWRPQYKLRAGKTNEEVQIDYLAALVQRTGEDWNSVELTLSTAQPMLNAAPPDLKALGVTVMARPNAVVVNNPGPIPQPQASAPYGGPLPPAPPQPPGVQFAPLVVSPNMQWAVPNSIYVNPKSTAEMAQDALEYRNRAQELANKSKDGKESAFLFNEAAALDQTRELTKSSEEIAIERLHVGKGAACAEGPTVAYLLKSKISIPSRNDEQVIEVTKLNLTPKYYYKAVPVLNPHVYRLADLANKSTYVLLPGEATMYQGADFVGRMAMPLVAIGEEFTAGFGVDPQFQVKRKLMEKTRTTQGGNQLLKYDYRILVNSFKTEAVRMQVWDRLPHSETSETANITLVKSAPETSKDPLYMRESKVQNLLRWDLDVEPGMNGEKALAITYEFRIELDRLAVITSFSTR